MEQLEKKIERKTQKLVGHSYLFDKCLSGPRLKIEVAPRAPKLQTFGFLAPSIVTIGKPK